MHTLWILALLLAFTCRFAFAEEEPGGEKKVELVHFDRLWDYGKPGETEKRFRELIPLAERSGNLSYLLQLLTQIARTQGLQGRFDDAHATLDRVEEMLEGASAATRVRTLLERGRAFNSSGKKEEARALFLSAWEYGTKEKADYWALDAAHMMGIVEPQDQRVVWNDKAMKLAETSKDPNCKLWLGTLYNNHGWTLYYLARYDDALAVHRKGWDWQRENGRPEPTLIAKWAVAKCLRALERHDEALVMQREVLEERTRLELPAGFAHEEVAENLLAQGKAEEAKPHFVRAWAMLKEMDWIDEDEPGRSERLRRLAGAETEDEEG